jgi:hypothetical protein
LAKALGSKHEAHTGQYSYKWVISKETGDGERTIVEIIANDNDLREKVELAYKGIDGRMFTQNQRIQAAMKLQDELPVDLALKVQRCIEATFGRISAEDIIPPEALKPRRVEKEPESGEGQS